MIKNSKEFLKIFLKLIKVTVSLPVTFLAFAGYTAAYESVQPEVLIVCLGVFFLSGSASVINQIMEKHLDAKMDRTKNRPVASGRVSVTNALILSIVLGILGSYILYQFNFASFLLGILSLVWYLGIYTLLKRVTAFAVIPGSMVGAIPPLIGWASAGGDIASPYAMLMAAFVFVWQIPHFWLLMLIYGNDYHQGGFPTLFDSFNEHQVRVWTFVWIVFSVLISLVFPIYILKNQGILFIVIAMCLTMIYLSIIYLFRAPEIKKYRMLFHCINLFMVSLLMIVTFSSI